MIGLALFILIVAALFSTAWDLQWIRRAGEWFKE